MQEVPSMSLAIGGEGRTTSISTEILKKTNDAVKVEAQMRKLSER